MRCPHCQHENRDGAKFCEECGNKLELACPTCETLLRPNAKFCDNCGTQVTPGETGKGRNGETRKGNGARPQAPDFSPPSPASYTPNPLAERIRDEQAAMA